MVPQTFQKEETINLTKKLKIKENEKSEYNVKPQGTGTDMRASLPFLHNTSKKITERGPKKKVPKRPKERKKERKTERRNLPDVSTVVVVVILVRHSSRLRLQPHWKAQNYHDLLLLLQQQQQRGEERAIGPKPNPRTNNNKLGRVNDFTLV
jgi:hypothetical protein